MQKNLLKIAIRVDANDQIGGGHFRSQSRKMLEAEKRQGQEA